MIWKRKHQCIVCGLYVKKGEVLWKQFWCTECERAMVEAAAKEHEDTEWAEVQRVNDKVDREYRI